MSSTPDLVRCLFILALVRLCGFGFLCDLFALRLRRLAILEFIPQITSDIYRELVPLAHGTEVAYESV